MSELEKSSDREVNCAVARLSAASVNIEFTQEKIMVGEIPNYCSNPLLAWPIIIENKISIEFRDHKSLDPIAKRFGSNSHNIAHKNPLRAAMIVYLEMNGVEL